MRYAWEVALVMHNLCGHLYDKLITTCIDFKMIAWAHRQKRPLKGEEALHSFMLAFMSTYVATTHNFQTSWPSQGITLFSCYIASPRFFNLNIPRHCSIVRINIVYFQIEFGLFLAPPNVQTHLNNVMCFFVVIQSLCYNTTLGNALHYKLATQKERKKETSMFLH